MGFDYYQVCDLVVTMTDETVHNIEYDKVGKYLCLCYDSDSEDDYNRQYSEFMSFDSSKDLYQNNRWLISSGSKIEIYRKTIAEYLVNIEMSNISTIQKHVYRMDRI